MSNTKNSCKEKYYVLTIYEVQDIICALNTLKVQRQNFLQHTSKLGSKLSISNLSRFGQILQKIRQEKDEFAKSSSA